MANNVKLVVFPAKDIDKTKKFFSTYLDTEPYANTSYYVGYRIDELEIGLDPNGSAVIGYTDTDDLEASLKTLEGVGASIITQPKEVGGGLRIAQVEIDGNILGLREQSKA